MVDLEWPKDIVPFRVAYYLQPHVGGTESPLNRQAKTYLLSAPRWVARMTIRGGYDGPRGGEAMGAYVDAFIDEVAGGNRILVHDFRRPTWRRNWMGGPMITAGGLSNVAAAKGASSIVVTGYSPNSYAYGRGDYIGGDGRAHRVSADAWAGDDGRATVHFNPPLSAAVGAGAAIFERVTSKFRLANPDDAGMNETEVGDLSTHTLELVEDLSDYGA